MAKVFKWFQKRGRDSRVTMEELIKKYVTFPANKKLSERVGLAEWADAALGDDNKEKKKKKKKEIRQAMSGVSSQRDRGSCPQIPSYYTPSTHYDQPALYIYSNTCNRNYIRSYAVALAAWTTVLEQVAGLTPKYQRLIRGKVAILQ